MGEDYGDVWVCTDCYFAHHYGAHQHDGLWYAGEDDEPVGGRYMIDQGDRSDNREPLKYLDGLDIADNTCSNHNGTDGYGDDEDTECSECGHAGHEDGIEDFSHRSCDGCHSPLGGARYRLHLWKREGATT